MGGSHRPLKEPTHFRASLDSRRSWYVLGVLTLAYALAYVDRQMLNLMVDPIKHSLRISDTQFSLIQGSAFAFSYTLAVPIFGRLVDITNRRNILIACVCSWSIFTALCGSTDTFLGLFLARCGVGVSEACIFPVALSLIADYFSPARAARALSIFVLGTQLGGGFSLLVSGAVISSVAGLTAAMPQLSSFEPWQLTFVIIGLPGLLFAAALLSVREPERVRSVALESEDHHFTIREVGATIWRRRGFYFRIYLGVGSVGVVMMSVPTWMPAFLMRAHGMSPATTGFKLGLLSLFFGTVSTLLGPQIAAAMARRGYADAHLRTTAFSTLGMLICCLLVPLAPGETSVLAVASGVTFFTCLPLGLMAFALQNATPSRMRGVAASLYTFSAQLLGYAVGPTVVALLTDRLFGDPKMVGYSLQIVTSAASLMAALMFFTILRPYRTLVGLENRKPGAAALHPGQRDTPTRGLVDAPAE